MLKLIDDMSLDHETEDSVTVTVTVSDGELETSTDVTVTIDDVNEAPELTAADGTVQENAAGAVVGAVMGSDVDDGDTLTYTTSDPGAADTRFEVVDGMLKLIDDMSLDHETEDSVTVTVTVSDGELETSTDVTVTIDDVNEAPELTAADGTVQENAAGAVVGAVMGSDVDDGDTLTYTTSDPGAADTRFEVVDGMLKLIDDMSLDHETEDSVTVTVTVSDGELETSTDVTVTIDDVNEAPELTAADGTVQENAAGAVVGAVMGSDVDDGDTLTYTTSDPFGQRTRALKSLTAC